MKKKLGLVIDQERCIGCDACTVACRIEHQTKQGFIKVCLDHDSHGVQPQDPIQQKMTFLPGLCNHCDEPPCLDACPLEAIEKRPDGVVRLDTGTCDGCRSCLLACPYGAILFDEEKEVAQKCDLCFHRIDQGLEPFCLICCEGQAIHFGDLNDNESPVAGLIASRKTFQVKPGEGTGPSVWYCLPRKRKPL